MKIHALFRREAGLRRGPFLVRWLLFGLLLAASWYVHPLFSLVCFVPYYSVLFQAARGAGYYTQLFVLNLTWNAAVTYWICQLKPLKGLATLLTNSLLFLLPVLVWHLCSRGGRLKKGQAGLLLVCWLLFEYLHHVWDFSWTWLTVGNVFGSAPQWVQWYAYTGVLGGSAWILSSNYFIFCAGRSSSQGSKKWLLPAFAVLLPVVSSLGINALRSAQPAGAVSHVAAVAVAIHDKDSISDIRKIRLVDSLLVADKTAKDIVLLPEVLLTDQVWLDHFAFSRQYTAIKQSLKRWRANHVIVGAQLNVADAGRPVHPDSAGTAQSRAYNAALMIDTSDIVSIKLKKVLVPVEEYIPSYLSFLNLASYSFSIDRSNGDIFNINGRQYLVGICYEVVNSVFVAKRVNRHTAALLMLSSESFFGQSEVGRRQYMDICRLRCVENNLPLVKSSNDGILLSVAAGGRVAAARRASGASLMHAALRSPGASVYHKVMPVIPWLLCALFAGILTISHGLRIRARRQGIKKAGKERRLLPGFALSENDVVKT